MLIEIILIAIGLGFSLAMDAFSVSLANGLNEPKMKFPRVALIAGIFAIFQGLMPTIGWALVTTATHYFEAIEPFIPWVAFALLGYIGGKMIFDGIMCKDSEDEKPYDQSFLLALIAPRLLLVGSAELDRGADPKSEFLTACHASEAWELLGEKGLVTSDEMPSPGAFLGDGNILYHYRAGKHFLSRDDWAAYIKFLDSKFK